MRLPRTGFEESLHADIKHRAQGDDEQGDQGEEQLSDARERESRRKGASVVPEAGIEVNWRLNGRTLPAGELARLLYIYCSIWTIQRVEVAVGLGCPAIFLGMEQIQKNW